MSELTQQLSTALRQIQQHPLLQRGWELTIALFLTGFLLLGCRLLGSLVPDQDPWRGLGALWLLNGTCLVVFWLLSFRLSPVRPHAAHFACWSLLMFAGLAAANLAFMPNGSLLVTSGVLGSLLALGLLYLQRTLEFSQEADRAEGLPIAAPLNSSPVPSVVSTGMQPSVGKTGDDQVVQWQTRKRNDTGGETVEGMICLELVSGQTQRSAHITFTPALSALPEVECEPLGDDDVETTLGDVYAHGFRVDVRRTGSVNTPRCIEIGFQAICSQPSQSAA